MSTCRISTNLAYGMLIYIFASILYLLITRKIGTPFNDSLTTKQLHIKQKSADTRRKVFYSSIVLSGIIVYFTRPFESCSSGI